MRIVYRLVATAVRFSPGLAFVGVAAAYILVGIAESAIGFGKRKVANSRLRHQEVDVENFDVEPEPELKLETTGEFDTIDD